MNIEHNNNSGEINSLIKAISNNPMEGKWSHSSYISSIFKKSNDKEERNARNMST